MKTYRLADTMTREECDHFGVPRTFSRQYAPAGRDGEFICAILIDKFAAPKAGEWFLSGALPVAYRTANDLSVEYHILKLVKVKRESLIRSYRSAPDGRACHA